MDDCKKTEVQQPACGRRELLTAAGATVLVAATGCDEALPTGEIAPRSAATTELVTTTPSELREQLRAKPRALVKELLEANPDDVERARLKQALLDLEDELEAIIEQQTALGDPQRTAISYKRALNHFMSTLRDVTDA